MKVLRVGVIAVVVCTILVLACDFGIGASYEEQQAPTSSPADEPVNEPVVLGQGAVVRVPALSPAVLAGLNATYNPGSGASGGVTSQAIFFATSVELELYNAEDVLIDELTLDADNWFFGDPDNYNGDNGENGNGENGNGAPAFRAFFPIEEGGSGFEIVAKVYNNKVVGTDPVVAGRSAPFTVQPGIGTPVSIIAEPVNPLNLGPGASSQSTSIAQIPYAFDPDWGGEGDGPDLVFADIGGEAWFELDLTGVGADSVIRVYGDPGGAADIIMFPYDHEGRLLDGRPALSWGFFPTALGGAGGTRGVIMGALPPEAIDVMKHMYIGLMLGNRNGSGATQSATIYFELLDRPFEEFDNAFARGDDADNFLALSIGEQVTQTVFMLESGGNGDGPAIHYFLLDGIDWSDEDLLDPLPITVTVTFDALETEHVLGMVDEDEDDEAPMLALAVGTGSAAVDFQPLEEGIFVAAMDPNYQVTEHPDGSTTITFVAQVDTSAVIDMAVIAVSSNFHGNEFTLSWTAPGEAIIIIE